MVGSNKENEQCLATRPRLKERYTRSVWLQERNDGSSPATVGPGQVQLRGTPGLSQPSE